MPSEICIQDMDPGTRVRLVDHLVDTWGIRPKLMERGGQAVLSFPKDETAKLHALIAPFVHPSMEYKLLPRYRGRFSVEPVSFPKGHELMPIPILDVWPKPRSGALLPFDTVV